MKTLHFRGNKIIGISSQETKTKVKGNTTIVRVSVANSEIDLEVDNGFAQIIQENFDNTQLDREGNVTIKRKP